MHGISLSPDIVKVELRKAVVGFAPLHHPPNDEITNVANAIRTFVARPIELVGNNIKSYRRQASSGGDGGGGDGGGGVSGLRGSSGLVGGGVGGGGARDGKGVDPLYHPDVDPIGYLRGARDTLFKEFPLWSVYIEEEVTGTIEQAVISQDEVDELFHKNRDLSACWVRFAMAYIL